MSTQFRPLLFIALVTATALYVALASGREPDQATAAGNGAATPMRSIPQYVPCPDQPKSFKTLSESVASGHLPSPSAVTGSWALIGIWVHKDSRPDFVLE